jgi:hypothetical protein
MGHVFFRSARLKGAAILPILILWLAFAGGAHAAVPSGDSINQSTHPSTTWQGMFYATSVSSDPQFCGPTAANDPNCDHFELNTQTTGPVRVVATWPCSDPVACPTSPCLAAGVCTDPALNDFDILVCDNSAIDIGEQSPPVPDPTTPGAFLPNPVNPGNVAPDNCLGGTQVAYFPSNRTGIEGGVFQATGGKTYEVRVIPTFIESPGTDYKGCAEYTDTTGTATSCAAFPVVVPPPVGASEFFAACPTEVGGPLKRQVDGSGTLPSISSPNEKAYFAINVRRSSDSKGNRHFRDKVNYADDHAVRFRSQRTTCATFTDGVNTRDDDRSTTFRGRVEVRGFGWMRDSQNQDQQVCFRVTADDWGQPGAGKDRFHIELYAYDSTAQTCSGTPVHVNDNTITSGNVKYKFRPEGRDEDEHDDDPSDDRC